MEEAELKTKWLNAGWYPIKFAYVPNKKAWVETMKDMFCDSEWPLNEGCQGASCSTFKDQKGNLVVLVTAAPSDDPNQIVLSLAHESVHVWQFIRQQIGEQHPGLEQEAYAVENILKQLMEAYAEANPKAPWSKKPKKKC